MKKILLLLSVAIITMGCQAQKKSKEYTINGTCSLSNDNDKVYLCNINGSILDSTIITNKQFVFKGNQDGADVKIIVALNGEKPVSQAMLVVENLNINVEMPNGNGLAKVEGCPDHNSFITFQSNVEQYQAKVQNFWTQIGSNSGTIDDIEKAKDSINIYNSKRDKYIEDFVLNNIPLLVSDLVFKYYYDNISEESKSKIMAKMKKEMPEAPYYKYLVNQQKIEAELAVGKPFKEIQLPDFDGNIIKLSEIVAKNKVTLIDFWASWCAPCRAEMPNVVHQYALYHDKGFEIYGVSLDNQMSNWKTATQKLFMSWIQVSDLKGWQSEGAKIYNIQSIPATVLINQKGEIIAKNLRGEELAKKLEELFK
ncbi:MAG: AhpC/TSA family protein [Bacteroidales bacterium]|nr:AhpC/TSA family protein [Bacteroidales bacterium]